MVIEDEVVSLIVGCLRNGGKVLTFGVGGNAANAIHFSAEMSGKYEKYETPLPCIDLCSNPSVISAIATDFGWDQVFSRQIKALAKPEDVVVAFSISTNGRYLLNAISESLCIPCTTILVCGFNSATFLRDGSMGGLVVWELNSDNTPWVQEEQLRIVHQICGAVKELLAKNEAV